MRVSHAGRSSLIIAIVAASAFVVRANTVAWTNPVGGNYSTQSNWAGSNPPGLTDTASFNLATSGYTVSFGSSPTNSQLSVGNDNVTLNLEGNLYTLSSLLDTAGTHSVEVGSSTGGSLTIDSSAGTGTLTSVYASIGVSNGQSGTVTVAGPGADWNNAQNVCVGDSGNGTLNIQSGGNVTDLVGSLGTAAGSSGTATVSGAGSVWNSLDYFYVGNHGTGSLTVQNGGTVENSLNSATFIGRNAVGTATVTGTNSSWSAEYIDIGYYASGSLTVQSGGSVSDSDATISCTATGPGTVTIGAGSSWSNSDDLTVGSATEGILNIQGNVTVNNSFAVANHAGTQVNLSSGTLSVGLFNTSNNPSLFLGDGVATGWTGGTLKITRSDLTIGSGGALGSNLSLGTGKALQITGATNTLAINAGSTLNVAGGSVYASTLNNAGTLTLPKGSSVEAVNPLVNTGLIDISGGTLQLDAGISGASVRSQIYSAYEEGNWDGTSGITSSAAHNDPTHATAVDYITTGSTTKIGYTWYGDANGDGVVNAADAALISSSGTTWQTGDFNYDGVVNGDDWSLFFLGSLYGSNSISTRLPEPMGLAMLLPMAGLLRRRRQGKCA
jgi:T5SS/PEP-CTERM-associated repeat protein